MAAPTLMETTGRGPREWLWELRREGSTTRFRTRERAQQAQQAGGGELFRRTRTGLPRRWERLQ